MTTFVPVAVGTDTTGCEVGRDSATTVGEFYIKLGSAEVWQESNGVAGLQRQPSWCSGGGYIPADTCLVLGTTNTAFCSLEYARSLEA